MVIYKENYRKNDEVIKPIKFVRPVIDEKGNIVRNMYISDDCELYDIDELNSHDFFENVPQSSLPIKIDSHGRRYAAINDNSANHKRTQHLARIARRAFDDPKHSEEFYKTHQVDHIDPTVPLNNNISNLEWVTPQENMYRAGKTGVMIKKYSKELIGQICEKIIEGESRSKIAKEFNVNENLIYDISTGKSHRSVSEQYLDKGFKYRPKPKYSKSERIEIARKTCELIKNTNLTDTQIVKRIPETSISNVHNIRIGYTYTDISKEYCII